MNEIQFEQDALLQSAGVSDMENATVGSFITFGSYPQFKDEENEPIEWLVLEKHAGRMLVISKYALDCMPYNSTWTDVMWSVLTWENCSLRKWLNEDFLNAAFNAQEQEMIMATTVTADANPSYNTSPGIDTTDKVFLLSIPEVKKYFASATERQCEGTAYCHAHRAYKGYYGKCLWWLRSPGLDSFRAAIVFCGGSVFFDGAYVHFYDTAVRPAMWIKL